MSKADILEELPRLTSLERQEIRQRLAELDDETEDDVAFFRSEELSQGTAQAKTQAEIFGRARSALP